MSAFIIGPLILLIGCILSVIGYNTSVNYIFSITRLNIDQFLLLGLFLTASGLVSQPESFIKNNYKPIVFFAGGFFLIVLYFYWFLPFDALAQIVKEDHLVENMQFFVLIIAGFYSAKIGIRYLSKQKLIALLFFSLSLGLFLTSGDEISWGQRIFHLQTPQFVAQTNDQREITIHNNHFLSNFVPLAYMITGFYGAFAWIPFSFMKKATKKHLSLFVPTAFLFPYFFFGFFYNYIARYNIPNIGIWSEPAELMLYCGVMFYLLITYYKPNAEAA